MDESEQNSETIEQVFNDFKGRRAGIVKALTTDVEKFFQLCDPEKDNLCLYGVPNGTWTVSLPTPELPSVLPDPSLGINFARDGTQYEDWLGLVAVHSDVWLLSLAFYFGARFGFDKADRKKLHDMINDLPTIYEVVLGTDKKQSKERSSVSSNSSNKSKSNSKQCQAKDDDDDNDEDEEEEEEFEELEEVPRDTLCAACGERYAGHEFWICCDVCGKWFHVQCEKITPGRAEYIKHCKFPCSDKRAHA